MMGNHNSIEPVMNLKIEEVVEFPIKTDVPQCFVCGQDNRMGLKLRFSRVSDTCVSTVCTIPDYWTGWGEMMHGGFHAVLLDEAMAWIIFGLLKERNFVTKEYSVQFKKPVHVNRTVYVRGYLLEDDGKKIKVRGEIRDEYNNLLSESIGTILRLKPEFMEKIMKQ